MLSRDSVDDSPLAFRQELGTAAPTSGEGLRSLIRSLARAEHLSVPRFSDPELQLLRATLDLVRELEAGLLVGKKPGKQGSNPSGVAPLSPGLQRLLGMAGLDGAPTTRRIRILDDPRLTLDAELFAMLSRALLERQRLLIDYRGYGKTRRDPPPAPQRLDISPQRLIRYANHWYLDALRHPNGELERLALDGISEPRLRLEVAEEVSERLLDQALDGRFGIFLEG